MMALDAMLVGCRPHITYVLAFWNKNNAIYNHMFTCSHKIILFKAALIGLLQTLLTQRFALRALFAIRNPLRAE